VIFFSFEFDKQLFSLKKEHYDQVYAVNLFHMKIFKERLPALVRDLFYIFKWGDKKFHNKMKENLNVKKKK
jgi:hypothetical protein